jgi:hypothetical protein
MRQRQWRGPGFKTKEALTVPLRKNKPQVKQQAASKQVLRLSIKQQASKFQGIK